MRVARIRKSDYVVVNVELWNSLPAETAEYLFKDCANYSNADIGNIYDPNTDTFSSPYVPPEPPPPLDWDAEGVARTGRIKKKLADYGYYDEAILPMVGNKIKF
jgi:hypothetical protein